MSYAPLQVKPDGKVGKFVRLVTADARGNGGQLSPRRARRRHFQEFDAAADHVANVGLGEAHR